MVVGADARLLNASVSIKDVDRRHLTIVNPCDIDPQWGSKDGGGSWNSEHDGVIDPRVGRSHGCAADGRDAAGVNGKLSRSPQSSRTQFGGLADNNQIASLDRV